MSFEDDFLELMPHTIGIKHKTGRDNYGNKTFGAVTNVRGRVSYTPRRIISHDGQEVITDGQAWLSGTTSSGLLITDVLVLPDGSERDLFRVDVIADEDGEHHRVAYF